MTETSNNLTQINQQIGAVQKNIASQLEYEQTEIDHQAQFLTFLSGKETFAIPILRIKEILECSNITIVPMMPDWVRGVINLRGSIVPVIDLSLHFRRNITKIAKWTCIVVVEVESDDDDIQDVGILVDAVSEVLEIHAEDIEQTPTFGTKIQPEYIEAMGKVNNKFIIILNVNRTLSIDHLAGISTAEI